MRRRERYAGLVWLRELPDDPADGRLAVPLAGLETIQSSVSYLIGEAKRIVEVEEEHGAYTVRCMPRPGAAAIGIPRVATSYKGVNLRNILAAAVQDLVLLSKTPDLARLSPTEVQRWVA